MSTDRHLDVSFDPELAEVLRQLGGYAPVGMTDREIARFRSLFQPTPADLIADAAVTCIDHAIPGAGGAEIVVSVIARQGHESPGAGILGIHGGGMVMGNRFAGTRPLVDWALRHDAVCVSVEYRLAPEHPAPTAVEDCYAALVWMSEHAAELMFDPERLVIFGGSAGGGLAAGVSLLARDRGGPKLIGQLLQCPMLDDRNETASSRRFEGVGVWDRVCNLTAWEAVLGGDRGGDQVSPYVAPARMPDLSGLPAAFVDVGGAEVFRDEAVDYVQRLLAAGVACELHVWAGAFHGFYDVAPNSSVARACIAARETWLERLLASGGS